jgi:hypothetical protein
VGFQNTQQALPVMNNRLTRPPEVFQSLFVGGFGAQPPEGFAGSSAGADDFPHESVEHLHGVTAELFFERLNTRVLLGRSFTHDITSRTSLKFRLIELSR